MRGGDPSAVGCTDSIARPDWGQICGQNDAFGHASNMFGKDGLDKKYWSFALCQQCQPFLWMEKPTVARRK